MLSELKKLIPRNKSRILIIHYSCESFDGLPEGKSPRVTSIAIRNFLSGGTKYFSIHKVAERKKVAFDDIDSEYDALEKKMLKKFFKFLSDHKAYDWVHWNMRNDTYGFSALEHRFEVLEGKPKKLDDNRKFDLSNALVAVFGNEYIGHPRLIKLMEANNIPDHNFLMGSEEAKAFEKKDYFKLKRSTLRKVDALADIYHRVIHNKIKTNATWGDRHDVSPQIILEYFSRHWIWLSISNLTILTSFLTSLYSFF